VGWRATEEDVRRLQSCHGEVTGVVVAADKPAPVPRNCSHAGPRSLVDRPGKYSSGSIAARKRDYLGGSVASRDVKVLVVVVAVCVPVGLPEPAFQRESGGVGDTAGPHVLHGVVEVQAMQL
jgi:hypothetical protein